MHFQSLAFLFFILIVWLIFIGLSNKKIPAKNFILFANLVFFLSYGIRNLIILISISVLDFFLAILICNNPKNRKLFLWLSVCVNMAVLLYFKYYLTNNGFFEISSNISLLSIAQATSIPFGISFYTFESMSYVIDVYKNKITPRKKITDYLFFISYFPHLVSGPIIRPKLFFEDVEKNFKFKIENLNSGAYLFLLGLLKKVFIADLIGRYWIDEIFINPQNYKGFELWAASCGFLVKICYDLSGYTDMARGISKLFNIELPLNFEAPFFAKNLADFWRRWHQSLSFWFRDYFYKEFFPDHVSQTRKRIGAVLTFVLIGLWHGATISQVTWGLTQGLGYLVYMLIRDILKKFRINFGYASTIFTFLFVSAGAGLYEVDSMTNLKIFYGNSLKLGIEDFEKIPTLWFIFSAFSVFFQYGTYTGFKYQVMKRLEKMGFPLGLALSGVIFVIIYLNNSNISTFMYYRH